MTISNLLMSALRVIPRNRFQFRHFIEGSISEVGIAVQQYEQTWTDGYGMVQPGIISSFGGKNVSEKEYHDLGMDFSRRSCTAWIRGANLHASVDKSSPDQIKWCNDIYNVIHVSDWEDYNGWQRVYCQEVVNG